MAPAKRCSLQPPEIEFTKMATEGVRFERRPPLFFTDRTRGHPSGGHTRKSHPRSIRTAVTVVRQSWAMPSVAEGDPSLVGGVPRGFHARLPAAGGRCCAWDHSHGSWSTSRHPLGSPRMSYSRENTHARCSKSTASPTTGEDISPSHTTSMCTHRRRTRAPARARVPSRGSQTISATSWSCTLRQELPLP